MTNKIFTFLQKYQLLTPEKPLVLGVSGGSDSMAMLHFFITHQKKLQIPALYVCHINHQLRGKEGEKDGHLVSSFCTTHHVFCQIKSYPVAAMAKQQKKSIELMAREVRYHSFQTLAKKVGGLLCTAHNQNDVGETFFLNAIRGSGLQSLTSIPIQRGNIIRPLLCCSKEEILSYCDIHQIPYANDSSNVQNIYSRNKIRNLIFPVLKEIQPQVIQNLYRLTQTLKEEEDYLSQVANIHFLPAVKETTLSMENIRWLHPCIQKRCLMKFFNQQGLPYQTQLLDTILDLVWKKEGKINLSGNQYLLWRHETLQVVQGENLQKISYEIPLKSGIFSLFPNHQVRIEVLGKKSFTENQKKGFDFILDYDKIKDIAVIRNRNIGDTIHLPKRNITKSFKKFCIEEKIPLKSRSILPLIAIKTQIIRVMGYPQTDDYGVSCVTENFCTITFLGDYFEKRHFKNTDPRR